MPGFVCRTCKGKGHIYQNGRSLPCPGRHCANHREAALNMLDEVAHRYVNGVVPAENLALAHRRALRAGVPDSDIARVIRRTGADREALHRIRKATGMRV